jgi:hypothetical protein
MKTRLMAVCVVSLLAGRSDAVAQTNLPSPASLGSVQMRPIDPAGARLELRSDDLTPKIPMGDFNIGPLPFRPEDMPPPRRLPAQRDFAPNLTTTISDREQALYERLTEDRAMRKSIADEGALAHAMRRTFEPEVVQFHHVYFASSILTAIKRKNPLSLLNPQVIWIAW